MKKRLNPLCITAIILASGFAMQVAAHPKWVLPSHFTFSKSQGQWATFDVSGSNDVFRFDKPASAQSAKILDPKGKQHSPNYVLKGKRRSSFDYLFTHQGTYKVSVNSEVKYWTSYKTATGEKKWLNANKTERVSLLPKDAEEVGTTLFFTRVESYITKGAPTNTALALQNKYLEVKPLTHPSDIVTGESASFGFYFEGKAQTGVKVEIIQDASIYRNNRETLILTSDEQGVINWLPSKAGRYLLMAQLTSTNQLSKADSAKYNINLTLEVQLNE